MAGFDELGLKDSLVEAAREQGLESPSALQRSVVPVIRRGGNAVIRASSGSGVTAAYALALLDRFADEEGTRALIIVPTADRAERVATTIAQFAHGTGARAAALTSAWQPTNATIVVASAEKLVGALEDSQLKLDTVESVIVDGLSTIVQLNGDAALETILASLPKDGQRVFITPEITEPIRKLAELHARKALHFPARPAVEDKREKPEPEKTLKYVVTSGGSKTDLIARLARGKTEEVTVLCRTSAAAKRAERELNSRGFRAHGATYDGFDVAEAEGALFAYDPPFSAEQIDECFRDGDTIVCERGELAHLKTICADANVGLTAANAPSQETDSLNSFRNEIRQAARDEDLEAQMLILEPLFRELSAEEIAAAVTGMLRAKRPARAEASAGAKQGVKTWARLFLSVGERDGIRPADVVGAITGESGVNGEDVGKVEIRDTFCVVEIASDAADKVIRSLNGTTMKNRALRVDYDRKTAVGGSGRSGGGSSRPASGNREQTGRPPREGGRAPREGGRPPSGPRQGGGRPPREGGRPPSGPRSSGPRGITNRPPRDR